MVFRRDSSPQTRAVLATLLASQGWRHGYDIARRAGLVSGAWFMAREILLYRCAYWLALAVLAAAAGVLNWVGTSDDAPQVVMAALLAAAAGLGCAVPRRAWLAGIVLGSVLPVTGMVQAALGVPGPALPKPGGL